MMTWLTLLLDLGVLDDLVDWIDLVDLIDLIDMINLIILIDLVNLADLIDLFDLTHLVDWLTDSLYSWPIRLFAFDDLTRFHIRHYTGVHFQRWIWTRAKNLLSHRGPFSTLNMDPGQIPMSIPGSIFNVEYGPGLKTFFHTRVHFQSWIWIRVKDLCP